MKSFIEQTQEALGKIIEGEVNELHGHAADNWERTKEMALKLKSDLGIAAVPMFSKGKKAYLQLPSNMKLTPDMMGKIAALSPQEMFARNDQFYLIF